MIQQNQALTVPRAGTVWEIQRTSSSSIESTRKFKNITVEEAREGARRGLAGCDQGRDSNGRVSQWQTFVRVTSGPLTGALRRVSTVRTCRGRMHPCGRFPEQQPASGNSVLPPTEFSGRCSCAKRQANFTGQSVCKCFSFAFKSMCPWMALPPQSQTANRSVCSAKLNHARSVRRTKIPGGMYDKAGQDSS